MRSFLLFPFLVLAACGGASGDNSDTTTANILGTRAVPGGSIVVQRVAPSEFHVTASIPDVQALEVLQGSDYASAQPLALSTGANGSWTGTAANDAHLLVRMTMADGAVIETAPGDFTLR